MKEKANPNRKQKLEALLQQLVGESLRERVETTGLITVSKVEASSDLRWAKIWISIIGDDDDKILKNINNNIYDIQGDINHELSMRLPPRLQFFLDTAPRYAQHIDELIHKIHEEDDQSEK